MARLLIEILLIRAGVEQNPGPKKLRKSIINRHQKAIRLSKYKEEQEGHDGPVSLHCFLCEKSLQCAWVEFTQACDFLFLSLVPLGA
ncbi:hypothetical protein DPMN_083698 [Dreissena polymorpha]|uniref:Uncharacterized protein n=1 Tax=Dreissena polymorpha TaxID=45954 RepID=A0A9D4BK43_DREPO|nr:hypothetical protein DPMN_083698 [Dreissena polymorpha]